MYSGVKQDSASIILIRLFTNAGDSIGIFSFNVINTRCLVGRANSSMRRDADFTVTCGISC